MDAGSGRALLNICQPSSMEDKIAAHGGELTC